MKKTDTITIQLYRGWNIVSCPGVPTVSDIGELTKDNPNIPAHKAFVWNPATQTKEITTVLEYGKCYLFLATDNTELIIQYANLGGTLWLRN